ncbi:hypothetical protein D3C78_1287270 [compost metagenome]
MTSSHETEYPRRRQRPTHSPGRPRHRAGSLCRWARRPHHQGGRQQEAGHHRRSRLQRRSAPLLHRLRLQRDPSRERQPPSAVPGAGRRARQPLPCQPAARHPARSADLAQRTERSLLLAARWGRLHRPPHPQLRQRRHRLSAAGPCGTRLRHPRLLLVSAARRRRLCGQLCP